MSAPVTVPGAAPVAESKAAIAQGSQSFAAAARLLPRAVHDDTVMLYAWCRHADDVVDGQALGSTPVAVDDPAARVATLRAETLRALTTTEAVSPPFAALRAVALRHDFPVEWPLTLIRGFQMDAEGRRYDSLQGTLDYAYHVAGVVGVMMARVMGVRDEAVLDRACDLGLAFQLTNIARDVIDDAAIGRVYLPGAWLDGVIPGRDNAAAIYPAVQRLLREAEGYYASGREGIDHLPRRAAWSILAALNIYRRIGVQIMAEGPAALTRRTRVGKGRKLALLAAAAGGTIGRRTSAPLGSRRLGFERPRAEAR